MFFIIILVIIVVIVVGYPYVQKKQLERERQQGITDSAEAAKLLAEQKAKEACEQKFINKRTGEILKAAHDQFIALFNEPRNKTLRLERDWYARKPVGGVATYPQPQSNLIKEWNEKYIREQGGKWGNDLQYLGVYGYPNEPADMVLFKFTRDINGLSESYNTHFEQAGFALEPLQAKIKDMIKTGLEKPEC